MKSKMDFYIAFYEQLALSGFQAVVSHTKEHLADICFKGYNIAHLTKEDTIIANPHAEIPLGAMEQLNYIARETAAVFNDCAEKPYDEELHVELLDGSYKIGEFDLLLTAKEHPLFGYTFATFDMAKSERLEDDGYTMYYSMKDAMRGFAINSGLVDERLLFSNKELTVIHNNLLNIRTIADTDLTYDETVLIDTIVEKIEGIVPELAGHDLSSDFENEADLSEGVEP